MKNMEFDFNSVVIVNNDKFDHFLDEYVQLSEVIEVDFPELSNEAVINNQVAALDKQMTKVRADSEAAITALEGRKQELLAITYKD